MKKDFNYCPNCASKEVVFDQRKLNCPSCDMEYYHNVASATAVILRKDDEILFIVRNREPEKGKLDLPGGFTDPNETAEEACVREIKEELNIDLPKENLTYLISQANTYEYKTIVYKTCDLIFEAKFPDGAVIVKEDEEVADVKWIKLKDIDLLQIGFVSLRKAVEYYLTKN